MPIRRNAVADFQLSDGTRTKMSRQGKELRKAKASGRAARRRRSGQVERVWICLKRTAD